MFILVFLLGHVSPVKPLSVFKRKMKLDARLFFVCHNIKQLCKQFYLLGSIHTHFCPFDFKLYGRSLFIGLINVLIFCTGCLMMKMMHLTSYDSVGFLVTKYHKCVVWIRSQFWFFSLPCLFGSLLEFPCLLNFILTKILQSVLI